MHDARPPMLLSAYYVLVTQHNYLKQHAEVLEPPPKIKA